MESSNIGGERVKECVSNDEKHDELIDDFVSLKLKLSGCTKVKDDAIDIESALSKNKSMEDAIDDDVKLSLNEL